MTERPELADRIADAVALAPKLDEHQLAVIGHNLPAPSSEGDK